MDIGIIGTGNIGGTLARKIADAGHHVLLANRRGPDSLTELVADLGSGAHAVTIEQAAADADLVIVAVPFVAVQSLPAAQLAGKTVVDTTNYYPSRDGHIAELDDDLVTSSELTARAVPGARVVKAFNTLYYERLRDDSRPRGAPDRIAVLLAGDDADAKQAVATLIDQIGFDPLDTGSLAEGGRRQQPGSLVYNRPLTLADAKAALATAG